MWRNNTFTLANPTHQTYVASQLEEFFILNSPSSLNWFTLWNAYNAYMRVILIQLSSRLKWDRSREIDNLLQQIKSLETKQQTSPSPTSHNDLFGARLTLRKHLMNKYKSLLKKSKITHYHLMNKPSKLIATRVATIRAKTKIQFILSQSQGHKIKNP